MAQCLEAFAATTDHPNSSPEHCGRRELVVFGYEACPAPHRHTDIHTDTNTHTDVRTQTETYTDPHINMHTHRDTYTQTDI